MYSYIQDRFPAKDETSETTVRELFSLVSYTHGDHQIYNFYFHFQIFKRIPLKNILRAEIQIQSSDRHTNSSPHESIILSG